MCIWPPSMGKESPKYTRTSMKAGISVNNENLKGYTPVILAAENHYVTGSSVLSTMEEISIGLIMKATLRCMNWVVVLFSTIQRGTR